MRYSNCKLNSNIINSILDRDITSTQIDLLLWLSRKQDIFGRIFDVKYYDACNDIGFSHQEFYNAMNGLIQLQFVRLINRSNKHGWDVEILDNISVNDESDRNRYLNTNRQFLFQEIFTKLRANEKKLVLKILLEKKNSDSFFLYTAAISKWLHITNIQLIKSYIKSLGKIFNIKNSNKLGLFVLQDNKINVSFDKDSEFHHLYGYRLKIMCRKLKIIAESMNIKETIKILHQYKQKINISVILTIILNSLEKLKKLEPRYINWSINNYLSTGKFSF